jgi:hypothetical protein
MAAHDREFRTRLLSNTHDVLTGMGGEAEEGVTYSVIVDTAHHHYLVLPHFSTMKAVDRTIPDLLRTDGF